MENMEQTQAQAVNDEKEVQAPEVNAEGTPPAQAEPETTPSVDDFKTSEDEPKGKLEPWMEERLARERRAKQREKERAEALEREIYMLRMGQTNTQQPVQQPSNDPVELIKNMVRETIVETERERNERQATEEAKRQALDFRSRLNRGFDKYDDFKEVVYSRDAPITERMQEFLEAIPNPDDFAYNLVKFNSEKLHAIAKMHPAMQAVQLNDLYKGFSSKVSRKAITKAPAPPSAVSTSISSSKSMNDMSYEEIRQQEFDRRRRKR